VLVVVCVRWVFRSGVVLQSSMSYLGVLVVVCSNERLAARRGLETSIGQEEVDEAKTIGNDRGQEKQIGRREGEPMT
jgi:hypothetical protein